MSRRDSAYRRAVRSGDFTVRHYSPKLAMTGPDETLCGKFEVGQELAEHGKDATCRLCRVIFNTRAQIRRLLDSDADKVRNFIAWAKVNSDIFDPIVIECSSAGDLPDSTIKVLISEWLNPTMGKVKTLNVPDQIIQETIYRFVGERGHERMTAFINNQRGINFTLRSPQAGVFDAVAVSGVTHLGGGQ